MKELEKTSDEELVLLVRQDQELYKEIVKRYQDRLFRYVVYLIKDRHKAEDAVQNTFIKAFINLRGFNPKKKFSSWIYRIAHNEAINEIKRYKKEIFLTKEAWFKNKLASKDDIHKEITDKELKKEIREYLDKLLIKYREPLVLYYLEGKSYKEISDILRISVGGVGARINRAKVLMKTIYQQNLKHEKRKN